MSDEMSAGAVPGSPSGMPGMMQQSSPQMSVSSSMPQSTAAAVTYPEIYYRLQPYLSMVHDSLASMGRTPTQQELDQISDSIYEDIGKKDPDLKAYLSKNEPKDPPADDPPFRGGFRGGFRPGPGFGFRRRGLGRDFIDALLLAQLYGRPYPYPYPYPYYPYPYYPYPY